MASNNLIIGLEIGTSKICVVVGESRPDCTVKILGVGQTSSRGIRKGEIVDFETAMKCVHEAFTWPSPGPTFKVSTIAGV
jgi:cell division protein FtsA